MTDIADRVFNIVEAAEYLRISRAYFYQLAKAGEIKISKLGGRSLVTGREIQRVVQQLDQ